MAVENSRMIQLVGSAADWVSNDLVLEQGELGFSVDSGVTRGKVGDAAKKFTELPYTVGVNTVVDSVAALHATSCADCAIVKNYWSDIPGGGGVFYWDNDSSAAPVQGIIILPTGWTGAGRWIRQYDQMSYRKTGARGDGVTDDRDAIQICWDYCAANGLTAHGDDGVFIIGSSLYLASDMHYRAGNGCKLQRGYGSNSHAFAMITQQSTGTELESITFEGHTLDGGSDPETGGQLMYIYCNYALVRGVYFKGHQQWSGGGGGAGALIYGGDFFVITNCIARASDEGFYQSGTGSYRYIGGRGLRASNLIGYCGDDVFQLITLTGPTAVPWNLDIIDCQYANCYGVSGTARVITCSIGGPQDPATNQMTCEIRDSGYIGVHGRGGNNKIGTIRNIFSSKAIDNIYFTDCVFDADDNDPILETDPLFIITAWGQDNINNGRIKRVTFTNVKLRNNSKFRGVDLQNFHADNPDFEITFNSCQLEGHTQCLDVNGPGVVRVNGGTFTCKQKPSTGTWAVGVRIGVTSAAGRVVINGLTVKDIANAKWAVEISDADFTQVNDLRPVRLSGATTAGGVKRSTFPNYNATTIRDIIPDDIDIMAAGVNTTGAIWHQRQGVSTNQKGYVTALDGTTSVAVTFSLPMPSIQYVAMLQQQYTAADFQNLRVTARTVNGFTIIWDDDLVNNRTIAWHAVHERE